ncbi:hypothetical protein [Botrimarina hoheduenensis]|uniref:PEP-CTERM protein-sorting domain-containing protein n=1 Tax=Botrimarina hoheduenensis TaxID=2528000 RepID=A0A5C5VN72_9BACT|nr:hypothetical protein [Botrimarina hoheduenensis]TWT40116.1 hypothetical protein Pla111_34450 [Botrimarina hoheduenensis]
MTLARILVCIALATLVLPCEAVLIATDHFLGGIPGDPLLGEYDNTAFKNQFRRGNPNGGGQDPTITGFAGPWSGNVTSGSLGVAQWTAETDPLGSVFPYQQGGRARFAGVDNLQRRVQRELSAYTPADTYYFSVASQALTGDTDLDGFAGVGFTNTGPSVSQADSNLIGGSDLRGFLVGVAGDGVAGTDYVVRHVGSSGSVQDDVLLSDIVQNSPTGSPFVRRTIVKLEFNDDPGNPSGNSKMTIWQDPTDVSSEPAASASVLPLEFRTFALGANTDLTHLTFTGIDYSRAVSFDEPRLATTWEDAVPVTPGDFNGDGFVNAADYTRWRDGLGVSFVESDYDVWVANYGEPGPVAAASNAIPEPAGILILLIGLYGLMSPCRVALDE